MWKQILGLIIVVAVVIYLYYCIKVGNDINDGCG